METKSPRRRIVEVSQLMGRDEFTLKLECGHKAKVQSKSRPYSRVWPCKQCAEKTG
jgi:hypothetical protein